MPNLFLVESWPEGHKGTPTCLAWVYDPDLPSCFGRAHTRFPKFSRTGNHHGPLAVMVGGWQPAQQPPLSLHRLQSFPPHPASHPLINKLFSVPWACFLLQPCLLHICPLHSSNAPVFPVYKLSALKGRKLDKHTHSSSRLPLHKHAGTRKTCLQGSPKPLDHSVSNWSWHGVSYVPLRELKGPVVSFSFI